MRFVAWMAACLFLAHADEMGVMRKLSEVKFEPMAGMPACMTMAVQSGDPSKGPAVIIFKAKSGCVVPWHWHTASEHVMIVSGSAKLEMKGGGSATLGAGGYAMLPGKHPHQFTCTSSCTAFINADGTFDIHFVDADGNEITPEKALTSKR